MKGTFNRIDDPSSSPRFYIQEKGKKMLSQKDDGKIDWCVSYLKNQTMCKGSKKARNGGNMMGGGE